jgi:hypothetical protein
MDPERIRELRLSSPFKPFNLVLRDGRKLPVDRPNALAMSPDGKLLVFLTLDSWFEQLSPNAVTDVDFEVNLGEVNRQRLLATARGR